MADSPEDSVQAAQRTGESPSQVNNTTVVDANDKMADFTANDHPRLEHQASSIGLDEAARLKDLGAAVRDQDDLERDIGQQVREVCPSHSLSSSSHVLKGRQTSHRASRRT